MPPPSKLGAGGPFGRILSSGGPEIDVYLDIITNIKRGSDWRRTTASLERGESLMVHRMREPETLTLDVVASDVEPFAGAFLAGRWEQDHAEKTYERLLEAQAFDRELRVWTGRKYERTPAGIGVWVLDRIDGPGLMPGDSGVLRVTLTFGESPRFVTAFTSATANVGEELEDVAGDPAERGRQSTTTVDGESAASIAQGSWP